MKKYIPTIGLEIHAELKTNSKMFCSCKNDPFSNPSTTLRAGPNKNVCPVCLALPGSLPVFNQQAIEWTAMIGKALKCEINKNSVWSRKHYFYPDLPKGFQISQYDQPLCQNGELNGVKIIRVHLEEDTGKLIHPVGENYSLIDYNRAGVPLVELVTEPEIKTGAEAKKFAEDYQMLLRHLGVSDANMERGEMRCEVNISLRKSEIRNPKSETNSNIKIQNSKLGTKVEIKNLNSFKAVEKAIEYEIKRQTETLEKGEEIIQETRGWNEKKNITIAQRTKEESADYRYFPEPDLPLVDTSGISNFEFRISNLPNEKRLEYQKYGITEKDAEVLMKNKNKAEKLAEIIGGSFDFAQDDKANIVKTAANLLIHETKVGDLTAEKIIELVKLPSHQRKIILAGGEVSTDANIDLDEIIKKIIAENSAAIESYKNGKTESLQFLIGQVMKITKGSANPTEISEKIKSVL